MGMFDKFKDMIGVESYDDEYYDDVDGNDGYDTAYYDEPDMDDSSSHSTGHSRGNIVPMEGKRVNRGSNEFQLVIIEPEGFDECAELVDRLKSRRPLIVNVEKLDVDIAKRIFDFLGGATYALDGNVQKIANSIYVFAPENVDIDSESRHQPYDFTEENQDYNPWG